MNVKTRLDGAQNSIIDEIRHIVSESKKGQSGSVYYESEYSIPEWSDPLYDYVPNTIPTPSEPISESQNKKTSMSLLNMPGLDLSFGKLQSGKIAIGFDGQVVFRKPDGTYVKLVVDEEGNKTQVQVLNLKLDIEFYKVPTQQLVEGDLVEIDGQLLYVEENGKGGIKFVNPITGAKSQKLQQNNIFNMHFYTKVVSLFDLAGQQSGVGLNGINPMMLLALQGNKGGGTSDISELLVLSSIMGASANGGGQQGGFNPMMLMMLGDNAGGDTMKQFMMLQMMAGQGGQNPFAPISAAVKQAPVVSKKPAKASASTVSKPTPAPIKVARVPKKAAPKKSTTK